MAERELQKQVCEYLKAHNIFHFALLPPTRHTMISGAKKYLPDLFILINGVAIFIELKAPEYKENHKDRQEKQLEMRKTIIQNGGRAYKITSLDELIEVL